MTETRNDAPSDAEAVERAAAGWLAREDSGAWNEQLRAERDAWIQADLRHRLAWLRLRAAWEQADVLARAPAPARPAPERGHATWRMAAAILLCCALALLFTPGADHGKLYATAVGESRTIALADGSRLTLNTATRLRTGAEGTRTVRLESGEAYFDIAHDSAHPFTIDVGDGRITVLGTRFAVRRDAGGTRVLVEQGRVRLSDKDAAVVLTANQEADASAGHITAITRSAAQTGQQLAWREGRLVFDQTALVDAAREFNRYNARKLVLADPAAGRILIGGSFAPANLDGFVRLLEQGFGVHAQHRGQEIVLTQ